MPIYSARVLTGAALAGLLLWSPPAWPWGCQGHQTIADIAQAHLKPAALAKVKAILKGPHIDPKLKRFCSPTGLDPIADVSTWADDVRGVRSTTADWHFLDIPRGDSGADVAKFCPADGCVTTAIADQVKVLKSLHPTATAKAEALMFVIHLVGDLHQPLHCITNNDRGANCVPVDYFGQHAHLQSDATHPAKNEGYSPNLHAVWDSDIIKHAMKAQSAKTYATQLDHHFQSQEATWESAGIDLEQWARDSHKLAADTAYGKLPTSAPVEAPQPPIKHCNEDNHVSKRMLALHEALGQNYQDAAQPVIEEQLAKAGTRLAMVLNDVWP